MAGSNWQQLSGGSTNPWTIRRDDGTPTANYGDHIICDGGTVTLPSPQANEAVLVSNISSITEIVPNGTETIEGESSVLFDQTDPIAFVSDGTNWYVSNNLDYVGAIRNSGGTHQWSFDEGSGTTAADYIGSLDGTLNGPSWISGKGVGDYHLDFDGADDYVSLGSASQSELTHFTNSQTGTFATWVNFDSVSSLQILFGGKIGTADVSVKLYINTNGEVVWRGDDSSSTMWQISSTATLPTNEWRLIAATVDGSTARVFVEDSGGSVNQENSASTSGGTSSDWSNQAVFGKSQSNKRYFDGGMGVSYIDEVADSQSELQTWRDDTVRYFA